MASASKSATAALAQRSLSVIHANQTRSGSYLASPNFTVYSYSWLRDGAFIADSMSRIGESASAMAFYEWCRRVIEERAPRISRLVARRDIPATIAPTEFLHTRYTVDGAESDEPWWNHQLDGYGAWLWSLGAHLGRSDGSSPRRRFATAVEATARYLVAFWNQPCYDCWEENPERVHVATLAAIAAGLRIAAEWPGVASSVQAEAASTVALIEQRVRREGVHEGHLVKWLGGSELDGSLLFCAMPYGLFAPDDPLMRATVAALKPELAHLGVHRHAADVYFGGGEWILLSAVLGSYFAAVGDLDAAQAQLDWVTPQADEDGHLPEQVSRHLLFPNTFDEWVRRWGSVARPLIWSHAMFLTLYHDLGGKA